MILIYILITVAILSFLILGHEFGHFITARLFGVKVEEFSLGMGPAIFKKEGKKTLYSIRILPIGGYCNLQGETNDVTEDEDVEIDPNESFVNKPVWQRLIILAAGVIMNFIIAYIVIFIAFLLNGLNPIEALTRSGSVFIQLFGLIFMSLRMLFTGEAGVKDLAGPIGVVQVVETYYSYGLIYFLLFTALISVNLGILNLLPIPALDGGQILIILIEKIKRKPISEKVKEYIFGISYLLIITLAIVVAFNDIQRFMS